MKKLLFIALCIINISGYSQTINEIQKILASDGAVGDRLGYSVSISGNYAIIGTCYDDCFLCETGAAYIFYNNEGNWEQKAKLMPDAGGDGDRFGYSVSISDNYAVVGSPLHAENGHDSGSCYIFYNNGGNWELQVELIGSDVDSFDLFGSSVSISGNYVCVGAPEKQFYSNKDESTPKSQFC